MDDTVLVRDAGFVAEDWLAGFGTPEDHAADREAGIEIASDFDSARLPSLLQAPAIRVSVTSFTDGRGFTLARRLRSLGYGGRLRLAGPVIADQYAMARRSGFDEVEIPAALALRQPQDQWLARADWRAHDYRSRLIA